MKTNWRREQGAHRLHKGGKDNWVQMKHIREGQTVTTAGNTKGQEMIWNERRDRHQNKTGNRHEKMRKNWNVTLWQFHDFSSTTILSMLSTPCSSHHSSLNTLHSFKWIGWCFSQHLKSVFWCPMLSTLDFRLWNKGRISVWYIDAQHINV